MVEAFEVNSFFFHVKLRVSIGLGACWAISIYHEPWKRIDYRAFISDHVQVRWIDWCIGYHQTWFVSVAFWSKNLQVLAFWSDACWIKTCYASVFFISWYHPLIFYTLSVISISNFKMLLLDKKTMQQNLSAK